MPQEDVSEFLTRYIHEDDFNFDDTDETLYWYSFKTGLRYYGMKLLKEQADAESPLAFPDEKWDAISAAPELYLLDRENLIYYIRGLKSKEIQPKASKNIAFDTFIELYEKSRKVIASLYNADKMIDDLQERSDPSEITPSDIESVLCSGIPLDRNYNIQKANLSRLSSVFITKRMTRQRINGILNKSTQVERFDLLTLMFLIYAETVERNWPAERSVRFIEDANMMLDKCGMSGIHPTNPYEIFLLMCIVAESPLEAYNAVWERSYE